MAAGHAIPEAALTVLGITAGSPQTLHDVTRRLGEAKSWHTGDASTSESKVCYTVPSAAGDVVVVFASSGEMGGPEGQVNFIRLYAPGMPFAAKDRCQRLARTAGDLRLGNGLHLGATPDDVTGALWKRPVSKKGGLHFESCRTRHFRKSDPNYEHWKGKGDCGFKDPQRPEFNDCSSIEAKFERGAAVYFELSRIQSVC